MYKCLFSNGFPSPPRPIPSMAIALTPSTLYIMYRKNLCMVEGGWGRFRELGDPLTPKHPPLQAKIFAKGHSLPRAFGVQWEGENASC